MAIDSSKKGAKLNRTEIVTIRLDPNMRFAVELASRSEKRTVSSLIEWCIARGLDDKVELRDPRGNHPVGRVFVSGLLAASLVWDVEEADRFVKMAKMYPELLNQDEQKLWKLINEESYLFLPQQEGPPEIQVELLRKIWSNLQAYSTGKISKADYYNAITPSVNLHYADVHYELVKVVIDDNGVKEEKKNNG